jgi:hypothetical protein
MFVARRIRPISVTREAAGALKRGPPPCVGLVHCRHLPRRPCGQSRVISAGRGFWNRGGR